MELPKRKSIRLKEYDYSQNGAYFVTICTYNRKCLLGDIVGANTQLLPYKISNTSNAILIRCSELAR